MIYGDYRLHIKVKTSKRLLDCMYDHESNFYNSFTLKTGDFGNLLRVKDQVYYTDGSSSISRTSKKLIPFGEDSESTLAKVTSDPEGIRIRHSKRNPDKGFWLAIGRRSNGGKVLLEIGDVFRLGVIKYQVLRVQIQRDASSTEGSVEDEIMNMFQEQMKFNEDSVIDDITHGQNPYDLPNIKCRICLMGPLETSQPMIKPCKCAGTMGDMHVKCFRQWVINKVEVEKRKKSLKVWWKSMTCELCQADLSKKMGCSDLQIALLNFKGVFTEPYIILKPLNADSEANSVLVLELDVKKPLQIGRAYDNDFILSDISVSRSHADLVVIKDKVYLQDKESRFGTLLLRTEPVRLNEYILKSPWFQHGRTIMKFELRRPWVKIFPWLKRFVRSDFSTTGKITPAPGSEISQKESIPERSVSDNAVEKKEEEEPKHNELENEEESEEREEKVISIREGGLEKIKEEEEESPSGIEGKTVQATTIKINAKKVKNGTEETRGRDESEGTMPNLEETRQTGELLTEQTKDNFYTEETGGQAEILLTEQAKHKFFEESDAEEQDETTYHGKLQIIKLD